MLFTETNNIHWSYDNFVYRLNRFMPLSFYLSLSLLCTHAHIQSLLNKNFDRIENWNWQNLSNFNAVDVCLTWYIVLSGIFRIAASHPTHWVPPVSCIKRVCVCVCLMFIYACMTVLISLDDAILIEKNINQIQRVWHVWSFCDSIFGCVVEHTWFLYKKRKRTFFNMLWNLNEHILLALFHVSNIRHVEEEKTT